MFDGVAVGGNVEPQLGDAHDEGTSGDYKVVASKGEDTELGSPQARGGWVVFGNGVVEMTLGYSESLERVMKLAFDLIHHCCMMKPLTCSQNKWVSIASLLRGLGPVVGVE